MLTGYFNNETESKTIEELNIWKEEADQKMGFDGQNETKEICNNIHPNRWKSFFGIGTQPEGETSICGEQQWHWHEP